MLEKYDMIRKLQTLLDHIEVRGAANCNYVRLVYEGLDALYDAMKEEETKNGHADHGP